LGSHTILVIPY